MYDNNISKNNKDVGDKKVCEQAPNQIQEVITSAMNSLKNIIDVNTVVGQPITTSDGTIIIPISKVTTGFLAGGGEYASGQRGETYLKPNFPFAGGSGAYVQLTPVGFLTGVGSDLKIIAMENGNMSPYDKLVEATADFAVKAVKKKL